MILFKHFREVLPGRVMDIRYENLVANPEKEVKKILNALNAKWDPAVLEFYKSNRTVHTMSMTRKQTNN
jgi:hypothetical protein